MPQFRSRPLRVSRSLALGLLALGALRLGCLQIALAGQAGCGPQPRAQDEVWLVSSRGLCGCDLAANAERLEYWRFDREQSWQRSDLDELVATDDPRVTTVVFLHGNRIPWCEAFTKGWSAYRRLVRCADERPVRFVIWSWPSDKACGPVNDARIKAARTDAHGYYVGWFLDQLQPGVPVGLWGHSFGARIATGALHIVGGGVLAGHTLEDRAGRARRPMQVALLAAALDDDWLLAGHRHGEALPQTDGLLLVNNGCDRLLKRYHIIYGRRCCQEALGYVGLPVWCLPADQRAKVCQLDACCYVGKQHVFANYLESPYLMARIRAQLLSDEVPTSQPAADVEASETADAHVVAQ